MNNCRIYVCYPIFGGTDKCIKFTTIDEYWEWMKHNNEESRRTSYNPVCKYNTDLDKFRLSWRSRKLKGVKIERYKK